MIALPESKACRSCGEMKPLTEFYRHAQMADGRLNFCRGCVCERVRRHRRDNPSVQEYDRARAKTPKRKANAQRITNRWNAKNPDRKKAHSAVSYAIRSGKLSKQPCVFCGSDENLHAHHYDYSRPLDVVWMCARCHHRGHAIFRSQEDAA